jgi:hypothetical protein
MIGSLTPSPITSIASSTSSASMASQAVRVAVTVTRIGTPWPTRRSPRLSSRSLVPESHQDISALALSASARTRRLYWRSASSSSTASMVSVPTVNVCRSGSGSAVMSSTNGWSRSVRLSVAVMGWSSQRVVVNTWVIVRPSPRACGPSWPCGMVQ